jgi:hypothetical protein
MNLKPTHKSRILFPCWVLIMICLWFRFSSIGDQNCHCYAWHGPQCSCIAAPEVPGVPGSKMPQRVSEPRVGDVVTYSYGDGGWINHSAIYIGGGWCEGKLGAFPVIKHPLTFALPYGTHYQIWRLP